MTFKQALRKMPRCVSGNLDLMIHDRIEDLAFCTQRELDLYSEGEPNEISSQKDLAVAKRYYKLLTGKEYRWQE